jgi:meso-butanediol dehydrogenase / (S,S)-butanediol dehydrogenase / diacetyl reductase
VSCPPKAAFLCRDGVGEIAREVIQRGIVAEVSGSTIWRWLGEDAIKPWQYRSWIFPNLTGPFLLMKASIPHMIRSGGGSIINIASLGGIRCLSGMPAYTSSKAGLIMLTQQVALDYGPSKVRCNVVCPGGTRTAMIEHSLGQLKETLGTDMDGVFKVVSSGLPLRRFAAPDEITGICSYLASDDSTFMTGSVLLIDGGSATVDVSGAMLTNAGVKWGA